MIPAERLKDIEKQALLQIMSDESKCNYFWLITRVKRLTKALEEISKDFGTDYCDGNTMIAYKALESDNE